MLIENHNPKLFKLVFAMTKFFEEYFTFDYIINLLNIIQSLHFQHVLCGIPRAFYKFNHPYTLRENCVTVAITQHLT